MNFSKMIIIMLPMLLVGCASQSLQSLRDSPSGKIELDVDQPYQAVYSTVLNQARACYEKKSTWSTGQMTISDHRSNRDKEGNIAFKYLYDATGEDHFMNVDIKATGDNKTRVQIVYAPVYNKKRSQAVKAWIQGGSTSCTV